jgi:hypothetical protein
LLKFWLLRLSADKQRAFAQSLCYTTQALGVERDYVRMSLAPTLRLGAQQLVQCLQFWIVNAVENLRFLLAFPPRALGHLLAEVGTLH